MKAIRMAMAGVVAGVLLTRGAIAEPVPVDLPPIQHHEATLAIHAVDGTVHNYSPADLEQFPTYRLETTTPWRETPAVFEGVLLRDVLAAHGLDRMDVVEVVAENDFATRYEREAWANVPVLLATRVDGQPHTRRARGPIQFVIPMDDYEASEMLEERHYVWMAAQIKATE